MVEEELIEQPIRKSVIGHSGGDRVATLAERVRLVKLDTMAHFFRGHYLQCVIERAGLPQHTWDASKSWIQFLTIRFRREEITGRGQRRQNHVKVFVAIR